MRQTTPDRTPTTDRRTALLLCCAAWIVPGLGHLLQRRTQKGFVFMTVLPVMYGLGLLLQGRIFPFVWSEPLVALGAGANVGIGLPYFLAWMVGAGGGLVVAPTHEYGNTFLIVAGLLNMLVMLDAYDIALGRK